MERNLLIRGGRIIDPYQKIDKIADLLITDNKNVQIGEGDEISALKDLSIINASGLIVCPGFIDFHCHLREPGFEEKETIATGTKAAAAGGFY